VFPITSFLRNTGDAGPTALGVVRPVWAADALLGPNRLQRRLVDLAVRHSRHNPPDGRRASLSSVLAGLSAQPDNADTKCICPVSWYE
jgi:hypothetical protein